MSLRRSEPRNLGRYRQATSDAEDYSQLIVCLRNRTKRSRYCRFAFYVRCGVIIAAGSTVTHDEVQARTALDEMANDKGEFKRKESTFRHWIGKDKNFPAECTEAFLMLREFVLSVSGVFPPSSVVDDDRDVAEYFTGVSGLAVVGRYHLYISWACPWANRCAAVMYLKVTGGLSCFLLHILAPPGPSLHQQTNYVLAWQASRVPGRFRWNNVECSRAWRTSLVYQWCTPLGSARDLTIPMMSTQDGRLLLQTTHRFPRPLVCLFTDLLPLQRSLRPLMHLASACDVVNHCQMDSAHCLENLLGVNAIQALAPSHPRSAFLTQSTAQSMSGTCMRRAMTAQVRQS